MAEDEHLNLDNEDFRFTVMRDDGEEIELIPNGKEIKVTQERRKEYVKKLARYYLLKECKDEVHEFITGFY